MEKGKKLRVLLSMANNSVTPYFSRFARLASKSEEVELAFLCLYHEKPAMIEEMQEFGYKVYWIKFDSAKRKKHLFSSFFKAIRLLRKIKPDIVHTHLFDDSLPVLSAAKWVGIKCRVISKLDAGFHYNYNKKWVFLDRFNNKNATHIVAVSNENRDFVANIEKASSSKLTVINQGLDVNEVTTISENRKNDIINKYSLRNRRICLTVSRYIEWKGYRFIIEAADLVRKKHPEILFLFIGYGDQREELESEVKARGLSDNIIFIGWTKREDLNCLYSVSNVFVHASINEPFGYVIAEAMLNKLPVVATDTGAAHDAIRHKETGYLVEFKNGQQIAEGINYLIENDTSQLKESAYNKALEMFTVEKMWKKHLKLYLRACKNKRK